MPVDSGTSASTAPFSLELLGFSLHSWHLCFRFRSSFIFLVSNCSQKVSLCRLTEVKLHFLDLRVDWSGKDALGQLLREIPFWGLVHQRIGWAEPGCWPIAFFLTRHGVYSSYGTHQLHTRLSVHTDCVLVGCCILAAQSVTTVHTDTSYMTAAHTDHTTHDSCTQGYMLCAGGPFWPNTERLRCTLNTWYVTGSCWHTPMMVHPDCKLQDHGAH